MPFNVTPLKQAFRQLVLRPGLSVTVIAMLALGVGAPTAIFSMFHELLVQPLPVPEPERLVNIVHAGEGPAGRREGFSYPMSLDLAAASAPFTAIAAHSPFAANVAYGDGAFSAMGVFVSGAYFDVLGLRPAIGRLIAPQDEPRVGEAPVVVLSYALWRSRFGADPTLVGRELRINGQALTVIGVAPEGFSGTEIADRRELYVPLTMRWRLAADSIVDTPDNRNFSWVRLFARLRPGVTAVQASAALNTVYARILREVEAPLLSLRDDQLRQFLAGRVELLPGARGQGTIPGAARSLTLLLGVTLLVLAIVCVNVANLLLVRGASRAGEMAIRESIGASRGRLVAELLAETAVPAAIGGALALLVAELTLSAATLLMPPGLAAALDMRVSGAAIAFAVLATFSAAIAFGVYPALRTASSNPALAMRGQAAQTLGGHGAPRLRAALVTAQIAFSFVLLVLAGLFAESLRNVAHIDLRMNVDSLVRFTVSPRGYDKERTEAIFAGIQRALAAEPGVTGVASAAIPVLAGADFQAAVQVEGFDSGGQSIPAAFNMVGPSYFDTLGVPLLEGREFSAADETGSPRVVIVNERFTRQYGLEGRAIGKRIMFGPQGLEIVGVVADSAYSAVRGEIPPEFFVPHASSGGDNPFFSFLSRSSTFYVRTAVEPEALVTAIPRVVATVDPTLPVENVITLRRQVQNDIFVDRFVAILCASFAALATLLAAIGLYGVMAYNVAARTRELGLRLALGAEPARLRSMILKQVLVMASIGLAVGIGAAIGFGRVAEALLFGLTARDPKVLAAAAVVLAVVVLGASYWPARRASSIAPMEALRHE